MRLHASLAPSLFALAVLGSVGAAGCVMAAPEICRCGPPPQLLSEELHGVFEHRVEVLEADPSLGLAVGTTTSAARIRWSEADDWLFAIDADDPTLMRAVYAIVGRVAVDPLDFTVTVEGAPPNAPRVDFSKQLVTTFGAELGLAELEPVDHYGGWADYASGAPIFARDELTGELVCFEVPARYQAGADPRIQLTVIHRFERVE